MTDGVTIYGLSQNFLKESIIYSLEYMTNEEDFKTKANSFVNWLTGVLVSNLAYLLSLESNAKYDLILINFRCMLKFDLSLTIILLIFVAIFNMISVLAARIRLEGKNDKNYEAAKIPIIYAFIFLSILPLGLSFIILWHQLFVIHG